MAKLSDYVVVETIPGRERSPLSDDKIIDAAERANAIGADLPLEWVGAGATAMVFTDGAVAYKVARHPDYSRGQFRREYGFLESAAEAQLPVATPYEFHPDQVVIVREMVEGPAGRNTHELYDEHAEVMEEMAGYGWGAVEFKGDSWVQTEHGAILVDASNPIRLGDRLVEHVRAVIGGADPEDDTIRELRYALRMDAQMGRIEQAVADELLASLPDE